jgi:hypothetical protein
LEDSVIIENAYLMTVNTAWRKAIGKPSAIMKVTYDIAINMHSPLDTCQDRPSAPESMRSKSTSRLSASFFIWATNEEKSPKSPL